MKMQIKDIIPVIFHTMPIRVEQNISNAITGYCSTEHIITVCNLFLNEECMIPKPVMEMEVECISLYVFEDDYTGLLITVK